MQKIIIDAYNLLHADPSLAEMADRNLEGARTRLISRLMPYIRAKMVNVTLVFDGRIPMPPAAPSPSQRLKIIFSAHPESADDLIIKLTDRERSPKSLIVISSDNQVAHAASARGARVLSSSDFWKLTHKPGPREKGEVEKPEGVSPQEMDDWIRLFKERKPPK